MITEDKSTLNSIITDINIVSDTLMSITRFNGDVEHVAMTAILPSYEEEDTDSKNYIFNKPEISTELLGAGSHGDIFNLPDDEILVNINGTLIMARESTLINSQKIFIQGWTEGWHDKGDVLEHHGKIIVAMKATNQHPSSYNTSWRDVTELDMFVASCELEANKLQGYFDV